MKRVQHFLILVLLCTLFPTSIFAQYDTIQHDNLDRSFLIHLPDGYTGTDSLPMIIAMHGGIGSAANLQNQSLLSEKADEENFIVVYPQGVKNNLGIRTWNGGYCCGYAVNQNIDDVGFLSKMIDTLLEAYAIDEKRIYATGISNGGYMAYRLACELSDKIAAIAPVASSMGLDNCSPGREVPIIHFHSFADSNIPYQGGYGDGPSNHYNPPLDSVLNAWSTHNDCSMNNDTISTSDMVTFIKWSNCVCQTEIHYYISEDGGHSWPGGTATIIGDTVSVYLNANDLMWDFFQNHSLDCNTIGLEEYFPKEELILSPNPNSGKFNIEIPQGLDNFTIQVFNSEGILVFTDRNNSLINLSKLSQGMYFLFLESEGKSWKQRIIINQ